MYNLNVSLTAPPLLGIDGGVCTTPRTPEILNSLMAMTNPLEYSYPSAQPQISQLDSHSNSSDSPLDSPAGHASTPSVQQTRSQLIKAGVKLLIQNKRKHSVCDSSDGNESIKMRRDTEPTSDDDLDLKSPRTGLTPEDEDRRRRRRERNKIAATKCRMKKRERTVNLVNESEILENQNKDLKSQVNDLENQRRKLLEVLQAHGPDCVHQKGYQPLPSLSTITNNNCKYLSDLNYLEQNEIKYSECLKSNELDNSLLPPGYCKLSPTDINYVLSPDSGFVKSPTDIIDVNNYHQTKLNSDYIPNCEPLPAPSSSASLKTGTKSKKLSSSSISTTSSSSTASSNNDFILKNELIDTNSPYTTVQSADRFLFENSGDTYNNNNNNNNNNHNNNNNTNNPNSDKLTSLAIKDNTSNSLLEFNGNFDTHLIKSDYSNLIHHHHHHHHHSHNNNNNNNEYLVLPDHDGSETQFTDLDSGITSYTNMNMNGSCLV